MPQRHTAVRRWPAALVVLLALLTALAVPGPAGSTTPVQAPATAATALTGTATPVAADHLRSGGDLRRAPAAAAGSAAILAGPVGAAARLGWSTVVLVRPGATAGTAARTGCSERAPPTGSV